MLQHYSWPSLFTCGVVLFLLIYFILPVQVLSFYGNIIGNQFKNSQNPYSVLPPLAADVDPWWKRVNLVSMYCLFYGLYLLVGGGGGISNNEHQKIEAFLGFVVSCWKFTSFQGVLQCILTRTLLRLPTSWSCSWWPLWTSRAVRPCTTWGTVRMIYNVVFEVRMWSGGRLRRIKNWGGSFSKKIESAKPAQLS